MNVLIPRLYEEQVAIIKNKLEKSMHISLTTDMWTSTANDDYLSLTAHFIDMDFKQNNWCIEVLLFLKWTILEKTWKIWYVESTTDSWNISEKAFSIVHDNGRNITLETRLMTLGNITSTPYLAHTFQLVVNDGILKNLIVRNILGSCRRIVGHLKHSSLACKNLKQHRS